MNDGPWHVLHVLSNHEKRVVQRLALRSVEHYLPLYAERVKWTDRTVVTERPLFAGYVFARVTSQSKNSVISTPGVLRLLGEGERNMVSEGELARIRDGLARGLLLRPHPPISLGTHVRVRDGIFAGVEGVVTELRQKCRVIVTFAPVSQCFSLEIGIENLVFPNKAAAKLELHAASATGYSLPV